LVSFSKNIVNAKYTPQVHCHPNEPLNAEELKFFFEKYAAPEGDPERLTLSGFLNLYYRESYQHPKNVWDELVIFGYDKVNLPQNFLQTLI